MKSIRSMRFNEAKGVQADKRYNASKMVPVSARERAYNRGRNERVLFSPPSLCFPRFPVYLYPLPSVYIYIYISRFMPRHKLSALKSHDFNEAFAFPLCLTILPVYYPFPMFACRVGI